MHCLLVHFPLGIVLLVLLVGPNMAVTVSGHVACLATAEGDGGGYWVSGSGPGRKRVRLNRKNPCTPRGFGYSISATCVEEIAACGAFS